jgi:hypothetical protein
VLLFYKLSMPRKRSKFQKHQQDAGFREKGVNNTPEESVEAKDIPSAKLSTSRETKKLSPETSPTLTPETRTTPLPTAFEYMPLDDMVCSVCGSGHDEELLLLCDACNGARHTYCCSPPLLQVPEGDFICPDCSLEVQGKEPIGAVHAKVADVPAKPDIKTATAIQESAFPRGISASAVTTAATQPGDDAAPLSPRAAASEMSSLGATPLESEYLESASLTGESPLGAPVQHSALPEPTKENKQGSVESEHQQEELGPMPSEMNKSASMKLSSPFQESPEAGTDRHPEALVVHHPTGPPSVSSIPADVNQQMGPLMARKCSTKEAAGAIDPGSSTKVAATTIGRNHDDWNPSTMQGALPAETMRPADANVEPKLALLSVDEALGTQPATGPEISARSDSLLTSTQTEAVKLSTMTPSTMKQAEIATITDLKESDNEKCSRIVESDHSGNNALAEDMDLAHPEDTIASVRSNHLAGTSMAPNVAGLEYPPTDMAPVTSSDREAATSSRLRRSAARDSETAAFGADQPRINLDEMPLQPRYPAVGSSASSGRLTRRIMPRVGEAFQVSETSIPSLDVDEEKEMTGTARSVRREQLRRTIQLELANYLEQPGSALWHPGMVSESALRSYLEKCSACIEKRWGLPATAEQLFALHCILKEQHYNVDAAYRIVCETERLAPSAVDPTCWGSEDRSLFARGIFEYGKQFALIQRYLLPHRKVQELVRYYFRKYKQLLEQQMNSVSADFGFLYDHGEEPVPHARPFPSCIFVNMLRMQARTAGDGFPFPGWFRTHLVAMREVRRLRTVEALGRSFTAR